LSNSIYFDSRMSEDQRRAALYEGQLFVYSALTSVQRFTEFARSMIEEAFAPLDPELAQHDLSVERFAEILQEHQIAATLRISKGQDIAAGCGQLKVPEGRAAAAVV